MRCSHRQSESARRSSIRRSGSCPEAEGWSSHSPRIFRAGEVYEIPVVGLRSMAEVKRCDFVAPCGFRRRRLLPSRQCGFHFLYEQEESGEAYLVPFRIEQFFNLWKRHGEPGFLYHHARLRASESEKAVTFAILAFPGFEKAHKMGCLALVGHLHDGVGDFSGGCGFILNSHVFSLYLPQNLTIWIKMRKESGIR